MKRFRGWLTARLGRRLAFSHFLVIVLTMLVLQLILASLVAVTVRGTAPIEGDAGWTARAYSQAVSGLVNAGQEADIPLVLDLVGRRALTLPEPDEEGAGIRRYNISAGSDQVERLIAVTIVDASGKVLGEGGGSVAREGYRGDWDELVALAFSGEQNPYKLSRLLTLQDAGLLLGSAAVPGTGEEIAGVVLVEMYPSLRIETSPTAVASLIGFGAIMLFTSVFGTPVLLLALLLSTFSGVVVSRSLGRRLKRLEETANTMAEGVLTLRVSDTSEDEIGQLGQAFNRMAEQLGEALAAVETEKEQVEDLLRDRRELVANISHDLRTPIASVCAHLEALTDHPDRLDEYLPVLNDESARVTGLLDDLFELSRLDTCELTLDVEAMDVGDLIYKVAERYRPLAWEKRRIVLEVDIPEDLPQVEADVQRVEQILVNLLTNGLRYTPEGGVVSMEAELVSDQFVEVRVRDTGVGIPPEDLPFIFDRFYRGDPSRARLEGDDHLSSGSGLGLAIVKGLVEAMGGRVAAESTPREGTCIRFWLRIFCD